MLIQRREESNELKKLRCLSLRMGLAPKELQHYENLEKGFEGEKQFDELLEGLSNEWLILNDLRYEKNNSEFQIDSLLFTRNKFYLFEVKNYVGDYYINGGKWFSTSGTEIQNPLSQLNRCELLLGNLLKELGLYYPITPYLVFINPEFTLYQAPLNHSIILPTQLKRFMKNLNKEAAKITDKQSKIADRLISNQLYESAYTRIPHYDYEQLKKGIACGNCNSFITAFFNERTLICHKCGRKENIDSSVLRSIEQFILLFPEKKITTHLIHDWCKMIESKKTIWRILKTHFTLVGSSHSSYYMKPEE